MLADHLGSGDFAITRVVFISLLIVGIGVAAISVLRSRAWPRALGLGIAAVVLGAAMRVLVRWEDVTNAGDRLAGPVGSDLQGSQVDDFVWSIFGSGAIVLLLLVVALLVAVIHGRRHSAARPS